MYRLSVAERKNSMGAILILVGFLYLWIWGPHADILSGIDLMIVGFIWMTIAGQDVPKVMGLFYLLSIVVVYSVPFIMLLSSITGYYYGSVGLDGLGLIGIGFILALLDEVTHGFK